jgi:diguanylate cyclase (GGDEF)-like protein
MGGDEIALLLPGCSAKAGRARAEEIVRDVRAHPFAVSGADLMAVSVSAGMAHAPTDATNLRMLYAAADAALYQAEQSGRNRAVPTGRRALSEKDPQEATHSA